MTPSRKKKDARQKSAAKSGNTDEFTKITAELNQATSRLTEIIKQKESIINQAYLEAKRTKEIAQQESASINDKARADYDEKVGDNEITRGAQLKSEEIISEAHTKAADIVQQGQGEADQIVDKAQTEATQRKDGADLYSKEVLFNIEERLSQVLGQVRRGIDALGDENQPEERVQVSVNGTSNNQ